MSLRGLLPELHRRRVIAVAVAYVAAAIVMLEVLTHSIAVLPFADMSAEHDQQYLGDGIAEELLNALASIEGLNVAARTSSFSFAGNVANMTEIGETLHVRHVLEGSVRRAGQKLRVTAQLIDVKSGFQLFTQSYDREVQDIFNVQNDIAHEIASALLPKLGLSRDVMLGRQGTTNLEAYNLKLKVPARNRNHPVIGKNPRFIALLKRMGLED